MSAGIATILATRSGGIGGVDLVVLAPRIRPNRELIYVRTPPDNLYRIRPDGTGDIPLTDPADYLTSSSWSPDGERIALMYFPALAGMRSGLHVMKADGRDQLELVADAWGIPRWSPDGGRILFREARSGRRMDGESARPSKNASSSC